MSKFNEAQILSVRKNQLKRFVYFSFGLIYPTQS